MRGHIRKRTRDSWTVVVELPRDPVTGKRRQKWVAVNGTKKEAEKELARLINELETGFYTEPSKMTFGEYLDLWLGAMKNKVKQTTWNEYMYRIKRWKNTDTAAKPLQKVTAMDIEIELQKFNLNPSRTKDLYVIAKEALKKATATGFLSRNPMDAVDPPKVAQKEMKVWTKEEAAAFLKATADHKYYVLFYLALKTGARLGELLALQWENIDLERKTVQVKHSVANISRETVLQSPKTRSALRNIPIDEATVNVLKNHKKLTTERALKLGFGRVSWVFWSSRTGRPLYLFSASRIFRIAVGKSGVPMIRFHDLRHTHTTFLLEANVHPKIISERLGHSSVQITLDRYSHILPNMQGEAVKATKNLGF
ncbi:MAG TPA: site-specific integrase [Desulfotomaculum sp.]|nr:site-specific integrase [Desulfotomaculum sp.]